jgi:hypothetical protein
VTEADRWPSRLERVADLVPPSSRVIDLGAGAQGLRDYLPPSCHYTPADLPDFDMNAGLWPEGRWDIAVMAGVLEYADDPSDALRKVRDLAPMAVLTDAHLGDDELYRNRIDLLAFSTMASRAGWRASLTGSWRTRQIKPQAIWELRAR